MITSIDDKNVFDKIQHPFVIKKKTLSKLGIMGDFLNLVKNIYKKEKTPLQLISYLMMRE